MNLEQKITEEFMRGEGDFFTKAYEFYSPKLYPICLRYSKCVPDANEMLQEAFIKVYEKQEQYKGSGPLGGWIRRIVVNTSLNYIRKHYKVNLQEINDEHFEIGDSESIENTSQKLTENQAIEHIRDLPDGYRTVFNLYVFEDYSHKEIAEELGISENTSKSQLSRARKFLRNKLSMPKSVAYENRQ